VTLGEGGTPLLELPRYGERAGLARLLGKDEGRNPTGAFKARGMAAAVSRARELGARVLSAPSAGNAGAALAAYAARAGLEAIVAMPADAPPSAITGAARHGARVILVDGLINDCGALLRSLAPETGAFDLSTLKEPYRVEGKKTMGLELAAQLGWRLPDVIVYPTGGGTGLVGMWKAFGELEALGWIGSERPRMISVQSTGCAPITRAFHSGERFAEPWPNASTVAGGMRVPVAIGDFLILDAIRESGGTAISVTDDEMLAEEEAIAGLEGLDVSHEAAATLAGARRLAQERLVEADEEVVVFLTGSGLLEGRPTPVLPSIAPDDLDGARRILAGRSQAARRP
jgi:threonine synthase